MNKMAMRFAILLFIISLFFFSCKPKVSPLDDLPPHVYEEPQTALLQLKDKYVINPFTGDSIKPPSGITDIANHPTGIEIPAKGEILHPDSMGKPISVAAGKPYIFSTDTNVHYISQHLQIIEVNEVNLKKVKAGEGKTVDANGIVTSVAHPEPKLASPPRMKDNAKYQITHIDESNGLSSPMVNCVYEDKDGNFWLGTVNDGVVKYDGKSFWKFKNRKGLKQRKGRNNIFHVQSIVGDSKGNIWFGDSYCVTKYDGTAFTNFTVDGSSLLYNTIPAFEDSIGNMWFMSEEGISKYNGKTFTHYTAKDGVQNGIIKGISMDKLGNIWITAKNVLSKYDGKEFTYFSKSDGLPGDIIYGANADNQGNIWISTNGGLTKYDGHTFTIITKKDGLMNEGFIHQLQDSKGNHWFTSFYGIAKFDGIKFTHITKNEGLIGDIAFTLTEDREGGIWVPSEYGISRIDGNGRNAYNATNLPEFGSRKSLAEDKSGAIWMGTVLYGLFRYDGKEFSQYTTAQGLISNKIESIDLDFANDVYITTQDGMCYYDGKKFRHYRDGLFANRLICLFTDSKGNFWYGIGADPLHSGLIRFDGKNYTKFNKESGLIRDYISALYEDKNGNIWISYYGGGVTKYNGSTFFHYTEKEGLPNHDINEILEDNDGNIWFANKGLTKFDGKQFTWYSEKQGIDNGVISIFKKYNHSSFLVGTSMGVSVISFFDSTIKINEGRQVPSKLSFHTFPLPAYRKNASFSSAFLLTSNNQLWKSDGRDLVKQDMGLFSTSNPLPVVRLNSLGINGNFIDFGNLGDSLKDGIRFSETEKFYNYPLNPVLSFSNNFITFNYAAIEWKALDELRYSYKMEGLNESWSVPTNENKVDYRNLPAGEYIFKVCAMGVSKQWGKPFSYSFTILPPWYATWWAYLLYSITFIGSIFLFSRLRAQKLVKQNRVLEEKITDRTTDLRQKSEELEKSLQELHDAQSQLIQEENSRAILNERIRVSAELHDEIGATLSGIAMYSHLVKGNLDKKELDAAKNAINIIQVSANEMVLKLNEIIWLINPVKQSLEDLIIKLKEYAQIMCNAKDISPDFQVQGDIDAYNPDIETRNNIFLFCKEAINNVAKYSNAKLLLVKFVLEESTLVITILDDGTGFNMSSVKKGNGLDNMKKRADHLGGNFTIKSQPHHGCLITLIVKITQKGIVL